MKSWPTGVGVAAGPFVIVFGILQDMSDSSGTWDLQGIEVWGLPQKSAMALNTVASAFYNKACMTSWYLHAAMRCNLISRVDASTLSSNKPLKLSYWYFCMAN